MGVGPVCRAHHSRCHRHRADGRSAKRLACWGRPTCAWPPPSRWHRPAGTSPSSNALPTSMAAGSSRCQTPPRRVRPWGWASTRAGSTRRCAAGHSSSAPCFSPRACRCTAVTRAGTRSEGWAPPVQKVLAATSRNAVMRHGMHHLSGGLLRYAKGVSSWSATQRRARSRRWGRARRRRSRTGWASASWSVRPSRRAAGSPRRSPGTTPRVGRVPGARLGVGRAGAVRLAPGRRLAAGGPQRAHTPEPGRCDRARLAGRDGLDSAPSPRPRCPDARRRATPNPGSLPTS